MVSSIGDHIHALCGKPERYGSLWGISWKSVFISQIRKNITLAKYGLILFYFTIVDMQVSAGGIKEQGALFLSLFSSLRRTIKIGL